MVPAAAQEFSYEGKVIDAQTFAPLVANVEVFRRQSASPAFFGDCPKHDDSIAPGNDTDEQGVFWVRVPRDPARYVVTVCKNGYTPRVDVWEQGGGGAAVVLPWPVQLFRKGGTRVEYQSTVQRNFNSFVSDMRYLRSARTPEEYASAVTALADVTCKRDPSACKLVEPLKTLTAKQGVVPRPPTITAE